MQIQLSSVAAMKMNGYLAIDSTDFGEFLVRTSRPISVNVPAKFQKSRILPSQSQLLCGFLPATVVHCHQPFIDTSELLLAIATFEKDSEFSPEFWQILVVKGDVSDNTLELNEDLRNILEEKQCSQLYILSGKSFRELPQGPYFFKDKHLYQTWRLYEDVFDAFHLPVIQRTDDDGVTIFDSVNTLSSDGHLMIPVASRLHNKPHNSRPLSGLRIAVKDIFDMRGVKTTGQNRSYAKVYGPRERNAACIQRLLDMGVEIVGKVKGTQFASGEQPTADWIEYSCPWNPRGDGYLSPRGSSTGSGVAIAGYEWLDVAIGSDTSGSMRSPSSVMGVFGNRPTHGLLDLDGMIPCSRVLDTAAFATRDVDIFDRFNKAWYPLPHIVNANCRPKRLLYPEDYLPYENPEAQRLMDSFVSEMEIFLGVKAHRINLAAFWDEDNPTENAIPLKEFVQDILNPLVWYGFSRELAQFRLDHKRIFHSEPYIDPVIQIACEKGDEITSDDLSRILKKKDLYKQWMEEKVFLSAEDGHLDTIIMYPVGDPLPFYRDTYRLHPSKLTTYDWRDKEDHQACLAGLPAISVPIGQTSYKSRVSGKMERVPASIAIMGARYTDHALTTLLKDMLAARNLPSIVKTGKEAF